jgi:hypothetical protein
MRAIRIVALGFAFLSCLFGCHFQTHAQNNRQSEPTRNSVSNEVMDKEMLAWELTKKKDKSNLANLLSEDFAEITDDGLFDKAGVLANLDNLTVTDYAPTDFKIRNLAPNTIQLIFKVTVTGTFKGKAFQNHNYASSLWMKRDGRWQNVFFQETARDNQ